jgi:hypothetical protein
MGNFAFFSLNDQARVIVGQKARLVNANVSYLFGLDGNLIARLYHEKETTYINVSNDGKYIWFVSNKVRKTKQDEEPTYPSMNVIAYNYIVIYNTQNGKKEAGFSVEGEKKTTVNLNHVDYVIDLPVAELPG